MGLFKKKEHYDLVLLNGHFYTQDVNMPWADAVAITGNRISLVGDFSMMEKNIDEYTIIHDLEGKYVFPGFINVHESYCLKALKDKYLDLSEAKSFNDIIDLLNSYIKEKDFDTIFGYGFNNSIINEFDKENNPLDSIETDKPIVLLSKDNVSVVLNKIAADIVKETAEEEVVPVISRDYILNLLLPFEFDEIDELVKDSVKDLSSKGYTSILNLGTVDYLENYYKDSIIGMYNDNQSKVRLFTSFNLTTPLVTRYLEYKLQERRTACLELDGFVKAENVEIVIDHFNGDKELLISNILSISERKFNAYILAKTKEDLHLAYELVDAIREKGYKNEIIIATNEKLEKEDLSNFMFYEDAIVTWYPDYLEKKAITKHVENTSDAIDELTVYAAEFLGERENLGTIEKGKLADLAVFSKNLIELPLKELENVHSDLTILNGKATYAKDNIWEELYNEALDD